MNKTFFLLVIFCIFLSISEVKNETYEWNNGVYSNIDCNNEWTPTSSGYCWSPYGFPSNAQITVPSGFNLTITVGLNYTGSGNGFETLYDNYNYGPSHAFPVESFIVQENAFLQINSFVALIVSSDSQISAGGSLLVNGKLAALDGKGNVSVYGNLTISGGNVEGSGLLEVMKGGVLYLDRANDGQENYLLRNTTVQQGASLLQSSGVTHTGFWWADGPVTIDVYGNISLSGYFYDWEQSGFLNIQKGGYFRPTTEQMRGISLSNYGTLDFSNLYYYSPVFTLTHYLNNYALVRNDKVIALTEYAVNRITNYQGVFHALDDLTIQNTLVDYQGTYVADETTITLAEGFINQYPVGYYGGLYGEEPFYEPYYGYINLNGTSLLGSGNVLIYGPISVYENLFIGCYTQLEMEIYSPNFYTQGNFTVASAVVFEIFGGGNLFVASPPKGISPINYFINVNGNLELNGITSNLIIKVFNGGLVSATSQNIFIAPPIQNPSNSLQSNEIWGKFSISGNYTSEISFFLYPGGSLVLEEGSYLDLIGGASLFMCGGDFEENGRLNGSYQSCPNSQIELRDRRLEMEKEKYLLFDQKMENLRSLLSSYDISL